MNGKTITGNVTINTPAKGTINLKNGNIVGDLAVDARQATVNNELTVSRDIKINNVAIGTWNEKASGNTLIVNDPDGIILNILAGKRVQTLTLNQPTTVSMEDGAKVVEPIAVNAKSTIISKEQVTTVVKQDVELTVKADKDSEGFIVIGTDSVEPTNLTKMAEEAIEALPSFEDTRITHKNDVLKTQDLVNKVKKMYPTETINGEGKISDLLQKIDYLENERSNFWFTQVAPGSDGKVFKNSKVNFEGYFFGFKYLEEVRIEDEKVEFQEAIHPQYGAAFKYNKELQYESGYYEKKIFAISQSGKQTNTVARFFVDVDKPKLNIKVKEVNENNEIASDSVEFEVTMNDNFYNLILDVWGSEEYNQTASSNTQLKQPGNKTQVVTVNNLDLGENNITFELTDVAGNKTEETITITRVQDATVAATQTAQDAIDAIGEKEVYSVEYKTVVNTANEKVNVAKQLGITEEQIGADRIANLNAAISLIEALDGIQSKIKSIVNEESATALTGAVKNADLVKILELQTSFDEVKVNTIPAEWINQMLIDAGNDIAGFFTTGLASDRSLVISSIKNAGATEEQQNIIMAVYDKLVAAL